MKKLLLGLVFILTTNFIQAQSKLDSHNLTNKPIKTTKIQNSNLKQEKIPVVSLVNQPPKETKLESPVVKVEEKKEPVINKELFIPKSDTYNSEKDKKVKGSIYSDGNLYCYQVSAFKSDKVAQGEAKSLTKMGFKAYVVKFTQNKSTWYRVRVGDFYSLEEAEKSLKKFNKK